MDRSPDGLALSATAPWPSPLRAWYAVAVLVLAFVFSFVDRIVIALLVEPIKADLGISDFGIGLLQGFAFALFYALLGIPIGRLSDRVSRRGIIATGIAIWSLMTAACGLARSFFGLFLARVGVGVGEATLSPAAYSMISDYFPREQLGRALGVYQSGALLGAGIAFLVGGAAVQMLSVYDGQVLPVLGEVRMWQLAFFVVGLPGLLVALLMLTVKEPARRGKASRHRYRHSAPRGAGVHEQPSPTVCCALHRLCTAGRADHHRIGLGTHLSEPRTGICPCGIRLCTRPDTAHRLPGCRVLRGLADRPAAETRLRRCTVPGRYRCSPGADPAEPVCNNRHGSEACAVADRTVDLLCLHLAGCGTDRHSDHGAE